MQYNANKSVENFAKISSPLLKLWTKFELRYLSNAYAVINSTAESLDRIPLDVMKFHVNQNKSVKNFVVMYITDTVMSKKIWFGVGVGSSLSYVS